MLAEAQFTHGKALLAAGRKYEAFAAFDRAVAALPYLARNIEYYRRQYAAN